MRPSSLAWRDSEISSRPADSPGGLRRFFRVYKCGKPPMIGGLPRYELPEIAGINYPKIGCHFCGFTLVVSRVFLSSFFEQM